MQFYRALEIVIQRCLNHYFNSDTSSCLLLKHLYIQVHRCYIQYLLMINLKPLAWRLGESLGLEFRNKGESSMLKPLPTHFKPLFLFSVLHFTHIFHNMCAPTLEYIRGTVGKFHLFLTRIALGGIESSYFFHSDK